MRVNTGHRSVGGVSLSNCVSLSLWKYTTLVHSGKISITKGGAIASWYVFERQRSATGNKQKHRKMNLLMRNKNVPCNIYMWRLKANWRHLYLSPSSNCVFEPRQIQSAPHWLAQSPKHSLLIRKSKKKKKKQSFVTFFIKWKAPQGVLHLPCSENVPLHVLNRRPIPGPPPSAVFDTTHPELVFTSPMMRMIRALWQARGVWKID